MIGVTAVMCIDYSVVGKWADEKKINYTSYQELSQKPQVCDLVQEQIESANKDLPDPARINKFVNLYKAFDADDEELTRTSKLRRTFVEGRYKDILEALYSDADKVHMDTTITYEDGREQRIKTDLPSGFFNRKYPISQSRLNIFAGNRRCLPQHRKNFF